jgi:hypothetical protein
LEELAMTSGFQFPLVKEVKRGTPYGIAVDVVSDDFVEEHIVTRVEVDAKASAPNAGGQSSPRRLIVLTVIAAATALLRAAM